MSITIGKTARAGGATILTGGTHSASLDAAARLYAASFPVPTSSYHGFVDCWPDRVSDRPVRIAEWPGGFPLKILGFPLIDPRRKGVRNVIQIVGELYDQGWRHIALVGFSHGGTIAIRALDELLRTPRYSDCVFRLVTLATPPLRDTMSAALRVGNHVKDPHNELTYRVNWLGLCDREDSVITGWAGIIEHLGSPRHDFGCETSFRQLAAPRSGIAAHDGLPGSRECREAIQNWFLR